MDDRSELERRLDALYAAVRDGATVDRQAAFAIAMDELDYLPLHAEARGFEQTPERFARLERALDAVRADMRADRAERGGQAGPAGLDPRNAVVETWTGDQGWTAGISPSNAADDLSALVAVAEQARQAIMESLQYQSTGRVWPACPAHGAGTSPEARHGTAPPTARS